jgi:tRNA dimethylallyltransferase
LSIEALIGPTCVGKTSWSLDRAESVGAEIISADSRQIYREMSIGTAKPTNDELGRVPHHFISERSLSEPITAAEFALEAADRIEQILSREKNVLIVGGATLYIHALLFGLDDIPPTDPVVREKLSNRLESDGIDSLVAELSHIDPTTAERIDLKNPRRILRALEVFHTTGKPISTFTTQTTSDLRPPTFEAKVFVLDRPREELYARINDRVDSMFEAGLAEEVASIRAAGYPPTLQALQTIGYKETFEYLDGRLSLEETAELVKRNTRRYAKRQRTWFRRYDGIEWITDPPES